MKNFLQQRQLLRERLQEACSIAHFVVVEPVAHHVVLVSLIHEVLPPFVGVVHLLRVRGHKRVEPSVVRAVVHPRLLSQDAAQALRFLSPRAKVRRDLDNDVAIWNVQRKVTDR